MGQASAEALRRGPITAGQEAYGPGDAGFVPYACLVPVPSATLSAAPIGWPLIPMVSRALALAGKCP